MISRKQTKGTFQTEFNMLGALNAISHEMVVITNTRYINAYSVCELLIKLTRNCGSLPISLVLDNAKYKSVGWCEQLQDYLTLSCYICPRILQILT